MVVIQNGGTFYSFHKEEIGEPLAKTQHKQQEDNSTDDVYYLENIYRTEQPFIS